MPNSRLSGLDTVLVGDSRLVDGTAALARADEAARAGEGDDVEDGDHTEEAEHPLEHRGDEGHNRLVEGALGHAVSSHVVAEDVVADVGAGVVDGTDAAHVVEFLHAFVEKGISVDRVVLDTVQPHAAQDDEGDLDDEDRDHDDGEESEDELGAAVVGLAAGDQHSNREHEKHEADNEESVHGGHGVAGEDVLTAVGEHDKSVHSERGHGEAEQQENKGHNGHEALGAAVGVVLA